MQAQAAFYLPMDGVDLRDVFPDATVHVGLFTRSRSFRVYRAAHAIRFNVTPARQLAGHLRGFARYIESLGDAAAATQAALQAVATAKTVLSLQTELSFEVDAVHEVMQAITDHYRGCIFMFDSLVRHDGEVLVGPLKHGDSMQDETEENESGYHPPEA